MTDSRNEVLVLGIGNVLMHDEGVGIEVITRLEKEGFIGADLMDGGTGGFHLLGALQSYKIVIIVDASLDELPPGSMRVLHPRYTNDFPRQLSAHEIGLKNLIDAAILTGNLPEIYLVAISVSNFQQLGTNLSPEVESAIPDAINRIKELVGKLKLKNEGKIF